MVLQIPKCDASRPTHTVGFMMYFYAR